MRSPWTPLVAALVALAVTIALAGPSVLTGATLFGNGTADIWNHAWSYGWAAQSLASGEFPLWHSPTGHPGTTPWLLIDYPMAILVAPVALTLGAGAAYNATFLVHLAVLAAAGAWWVQRAGGHPVLAVIASSLVVVSPFVRGLVASGVPEALAFGVIPALVVFTRQAMAGDRRALLPACAAALWLSFNGVYGALGGAIACGALVVLALWRREWSAVLRAASVAMCGAVPVAFTVVMLRVTEHAATAGGERSVREPVEAVLWAYAPLKGADVLNFFAPFFALPPPASHNLHRHTTYLGLALVIAAVAAAKRSRRARGMLVVAGVAFVFALGPVLRVGGATVLPLPAVGDLFGIHHVYRLTGLIVLCLLGAAVTLAIQWWDRRKWAVMAVAAAIALEGLALAPTPVMAAISAPSTAIEAELATEPGAILDLPLDRAGRYPYGPHPQRAFFLQAVHRRPIASAPYREPAVLSDNSTLAELDRFVTQAWLAQPSWSLPWPPRGEPDPRPGRALPRLRLPEPARRAVDREALRAQGFTHAVFDLQSVAPEPRERVVAALADWLGEPVRVTPDRSVYRIAR